MVFKKPLVHENSSVSLTNAFSVFYNREAGFVTTQFRQQMYYILGSIKY